MIRTALVFLVFSSIPICTLAGTARVSESSDGVPAFGDSWHASISDDGQIVVFVSEADNLVPDDNNGEFDVFLHDRSSGTTSRVSQGVNGAEANGFSGWSPPVISGNGRYVVFESEANNLVTGDNNGTWDIFVYDRETGETERVSIDSNGNEANYASHSPNISTDGRFVTFLSGATNLVSNDVNEEVDVFLHDRVTGETARVNLASDGTQANEGSTGYWGWWWNVLPVSDDGRYTAFNTPASNLVPGDTNGEEDVFVRDLLEQTTTRVSVASDGTEADGWSLLHGMSRDGRFLLFFSSVTNLTPEISGGLYLHDRTTKETWPINVGSDGEPFDARRACISGNGNYVVLAAQARALLPWATRDGYDLIVKELSSGKAFRASMAYTGGEDDSSDYSGCRITNDGRYISFLSDGGNLIPGDRNSFSDVFVTDNPAMFQINPGLNGSWFNPATNGQGFFIDVLPTTGMVFVGWSTFDVTLPDESVTAHIGDPGHRWLSAQGEYLGNQAALDIHAIKGGVFDSPEPSPIVEVQGEMLVEFTSCRSGTVTYNLPSVGRSRVIPIQRVALDNAVACESRAGQIKTE